MDPRVAGTFKLINNFSTGNGHRFGGSELTPGKRIRYTDKFDDRTLPGEMEVSVSLTQVSCGTEIAITEEGIPSNPVKMRSSRLARSRWHSWPILWSPKFRASGSDARHGVQRGRTACVGCVPRGGPQVRNVSGASGRISEKLADLGDWRGETLGRMRKLIHEADPNVVEEWKWMGTPIWSHDGILCTGESYKKLGEAHLRERRCSRRSGRISSTRVSTATCAARSTSRRRGS